MSRTHRIVCVGTLSTFACLFALVGLARSEDSLWQTDF
jgi:hypothetical protein